MSSDEIIKTRPPGKEDHRLVERFSEAVANQSQLMDRLAQTLITLELAIPGLYATSLKLIGGTEKLELSCLIYLAFLCWAMALASTLYAAVPKKYVVETDRIRNSNTSIEAFFFHSARHKWRWLLVSILFFMVGVASIVGDIVL